MKSIYLGGEQLLNRLLKDILLAKKLIHIQMYILADDYVGNSIKRALIKASNKGVKIYVIVDAFGSLELPSRFIKELTDNGIHFRHFNHFIKKMSISLGRRLHHKVITIDDSIGYVGGINLADYYFLNTPWLDFMVRTTEKRVITELKKICQDIYSKDFFQHRKTCKKIIVNDYAKKKTEITRAYYRLIIEAKSEIIIIAAYFLPSLQMRKALKKAYKKGVKITFITGKQSDVKIIKYATEFLYLWMTRRNVTLLEYQPAVVHGKLLLVDDQKLTVGSYNLNKLSDHASIELNLLLNKAEDFSVFSQFKTYYDAYIISNTSFVSTEQTKVQPLWRKTRNVISYHIVRWGLSFLTFFNKSETIQRHFK